VLLCLGLVLFLAAGSMGFVRYAAGSTPLVMSRQTPGAVSAVRTPCPWVSLTFDDGPHPQLTPEALATLAEFGARASFFVLGPAVEARPDLVLQAEREGHEVGNHTWSHDNLLDRSAPEIHDELRLTREALDRLGSTPSLLMRPPRGRLDAASSEIITGAGWTIAGWNFSPDPLLVEGISPHDAARRLVGPMGPGSIILMHDSGPVAQRSISALRPILLELRAKGLRSVPFGELVDSAITGRCDGGPGASAVSSALRQ
jgi:peptidoglycan-N-acetylglucosamine deacetylase